jgi:hypothetical protein
MALNIKRESAERAIRELAAETGESLTQAVERAAREKLERLKEQKRRGQTVEDFINAIRPLQDEVARERREKGDTRSARELMDELHDEQ